MSSEEAEHQLHSCFASRAWAAKVAGHRPYTDIEGLLETAEAAWSELAPSDWLEALAAHARIGERVGRSPGPSHREQSDVMRAPAETLTLLANENRRYEARFGHMFLISASGRSAEEILAAMRQRMRNDPVTEIRVAAEEHRKIARLRLEKLLHA